jgi:hypothetical protein
MDSLGLTNRIMMVGVMALALRDWDAHPGPPRRRLGQWLLVSPLCVSPRRLCRPLTADWDGPGDYSVKESEDTRRYVHKVYDPLQSWGIGHKRVLSRMGTSALWFPRAEVICEDMGGSKESRRPHV